MTTTAMAAKEFVEKHYQNALAVPEYSETYIASVGSMEKLENNVGWTHVYDRELQEKPCPKCGTVKEMLVTVGRPLGSHITEGGAWEAAAKKICDRTA